jgi:hypothetical protein
MLFADGVFCPGPVSSPGARAVLLGVLERHQGTVRLRDLLSRAAEFPEFVVALDGFAALVRSDRGEGTRPSSWRGRTATPRALPAEERARVAAHHAWCLGRHAHKWGCRHTGGDGRAYAAPHGGSP